MRSSQIQKIFLASVASVFVALGILVAYSAYSAFRLADEVVSHDCPELNFSDEFDCKKLKLSWFDSLIGDDFSEEALWEIAYSYKENATYYSMYVNVTFDGKVVDFSGQIQQAADE